MNDINFKFKINLAQNDFVICIDADTQLRLDALTQLMKCFTIETKNNQESGAVAGSVKWVTKYNTKCRNIEYLATILMIEELGFSGITVVPGAIGAFKRSH
jgi:cellulose synthase/poly-beta-1,6-N-acetylglucosamine synthase-like glycosyltransferase